MMDKLDRLNFTLGRALYFMHQKPEVEAGYFSKDFVLTAKAIVESMQKDLAWKPIDEEAKQGQEIVLAKLENGCLINKSVDRFISNGEGRYSLPRYGLLFNDEPPTHYCNLSVSVLED